MTEDTQERYATICAALREEWRLQTEHGIHHDHLSDLAWLIAELDHTRDKLASLSTSFESLQKELKELKTMRDHPREASSGDDATACNDRGDS